MNGTQQDSIGMPRGRTLHIRDGAGALVQVWEGEVWLTQEGGTKDHVLGPGESFRLDRGGLALVYSFRRSIVSVSRPAPRSASFLHRFWMDLVQPASPKTLSV